MSLKLTPLARKLRTTQTESEMRMWEQLRGRRFMGLKFRRQVPIENYIADFICFERAVIVELDGGQHADNDNDRMRTEILEGRGFLVKRYWNNEVMENMDGVLMDLQATLNTLTPALSLEGEGEGGLV